MGWVTKYQGHKLISQHGLSRSRRISLAFPPYLFLTYLKAPCRKIILYLFRAALSTCMARYLVEGIADTHVCDGLSVQENVLNYTEYTYVDKLFIKLDLKG